MTHIIFIDWVDIFPIWLKEPSTHRWRCVWSRTIPWWFHWSIASSNFLLFPFDWESSCTSTQCPTGEMQTTLIFISWGGYTTWSKTSKQCWPILLVKYSWDAILRDSYSWGNLLIWRGGTWFLWKFILLFQRVWDVQTGSGCCRIAVSVNPCRTWTDALTHMLAVFLHSFFREFIHIGHDCCSIRDAVRTIAIFSLFCRMLRSWSSQQITSFCCIFIKKSFSALDDGTGLDSFPRLLKLFHLFLVSIFVFLYHQGDSSLHWP